jgi:hypothetical protein
MCGSWCIRVFEKLSRARRLRSIARLRSERMPLLIVFGHDLLRFFTVNWENGTLVGKRLAEMRSHFSRRSWTVFALSCICGFM